MVFHTYGATKRLDAVNMSEPNKKIVQINPSKLDEIHNLQKSDIKYGYIFANGTMSIRTLYKHIMKDLRMINEQTTYEKLKNSIKCKRFWFDIYINDFFDEYNKREYYPLLKKILRIMYE